MECINSLKVYKARQGAPFKKDEAQIIGEALEEIKDNNKGKLKSEDVVKEAKKKANPLHDFFEWDNNKAGEKYRLQQARDIVNHIVVEVIVQGEETEQRAFYSVETKEEGNVYVSIEDAIENKDYREQLLDKMINILENLTTTMKMFKNFDYKK